MIEIQGLMKSLKEAQSSDGTIKLDEKTVDQMLKFLNSVSIMIDEQSKIINQLLKVVSNENPTLQSEMQS